jgi:hypothetical protein
MAEARRRLLATHRLAAARHEDHAEQHSLAGRLERARRERDAAMRQYEAIGRCSLGEPSLDRTDSASEGAHRASSGVRPPMVVGDMELQRLRRALSALLAWAAGARLDEVERRQGWCEAVVRQCAAPDWRGWLQAVCVVAAASSAGIRGAAITVASSAGVEFAVASDHWTSSVQDVELVVGEGPSRAAREEQRVVVVESLIQTDSWPGFVAATANHDIGPLLSTPMWVDGTCVGSVTLYLWPGAEPAMLMGDSVAFADVGAAALVADVEAARLDGSVDRDRFVVNVAVGVLAARLGIPLDEAEVLLRAHAFGSELSLTDAAACAIDSADELA